MKFRTYATCYDRERDIDTLLDRYPYLKNLTPKKEVVERDWWHGTRKETALTIEIESLEQLMNLMTDVDHELVVGPVDDYKMPYIEIYDGYRE